MLRRVGAGVAFLRRVGWECRGKSLAAFPDEDIALHARDLLDLHQFIAELGECLGIEIELPAERTQGHAAMAFQEVARPLDRLEEAHVACSWIVRAPHAAQARVRAAP